jgi:hypothetical protein
MGVGSFTTQSLNPEEKAPGNHWIGSWVGLRTGVDAMAKRNTPSASQESNLGPPARSLGTTLTELSRLLIQIFVYTISTVHMCKLQVSKALYTKGYIQYVQVYAPQKLVNLF